MSTWNIQFGDMSHEKDLLKFDMNLQPWVSFYESFEAHDSGRFRRASYIAPSLHDTSESTEEWYKITQ